MDLFHSNRDVEILDTTLRDGSYANDFQFTAGQTFTICQKLEEAGVRLIDVGHGIGLNASNSNYREALATDEEYMEAANEACEKAIWGMFCIPGIATLDDVERAAEHDMGFIRIGTNITEVEESESFIKLAKSKGMFVTANYMKSYASPPEVFAEKVEMSERYGADMIYLVDSAGGMLPSTIREYYSASRAVSNIPIGFHGHNNLGLAVANSLLMANEGSRFLDASLQGLGRGAGNTPTASIVASLEKQGFDTGIDLLALLRLGHKHVDPIQSDPTKMPLDVAAGYFGFHSSHMTKILDAAYKYDVDPVVLMEAVCEKDKIYAPEDMISELAQDLESESDARVEDYGWDSYVGSEEDVRQK